MRHADRGAALTTARFRFLKSEAAFVMDRADAPARGDIMPRTLGIPIAVTLALLLGACDKCTDLLSPFKRTSGPAACSTGTPQPR